MLVGGSSTGKTRACWEAVRGRREGESGGLPGDWWLWHPINPGRPKAVLADLDRIRPRTVVWLNETQHYLLTPGSDLGERVAAGLRELLRDSDRGPVLVLGTLWPEYWNQLVRRPTDGSEDPYAQARAMLTGVSVAVPDAFTEADVQVARDSGDERLRLAVEHARDGEVTQYLAGAPVLLERYRHAPPTARALLTAAMDARRLGHGWLLPVGLLARVAPAYLTQSQWEQAPESWLADSLRYAETVGPGDTSPLVRTRPKPGQNASADVTVRLADYLEQTGRRIRATSPPPAELWDALLALAPVEDCAAIGASAEQRGLFQLADQFYGRVETHDSAWRRGRLLHRQGRIDDAVPYYRRAAEAGDSTGTQLYIKALLDQGLVEQAIWWLDSLFGTHDLAIVGVAADVFARAGLATEAIDLYRRAGEAGDVTALRSYVEHLVSSGHLAAATTWLQQRAEAGHAPAAAMADLLTAKQQHWSGNEPMPVEPSGHGSGDQTKELLSTGLELAEAGQVDQAIRLLQEATEQSGLRPEPGSAQTGLGVEYRAVDHDIHLNALTEAARLLRDNDRTDELLDWLRGLIADGDHAAVLPYAQQSEANGHTDEAIQWYQRAAEITSVKPFDIRPDNPVRNAVRLMQAAGRTNEALDWLRGSITDEDPQTRAPHVELLIMAGRLDEAVADYHRIVTAGGTAALRFLMDLAVRHGQQASVRSWTERRINEGDSAVQLAFAAILAESGLRSKAVTLLTPLVAAGDSTARDRLVDVLSAHSWDDAIALLRPHADAGNLLARQRLVGLLIDHGRLDEAMEWLSGHRKDEARTNWYEIALRLEKAGRIDDAIGLYQRLAENGDKNALFGVAQLATRTGRAAAITAWLLTRIDAGDVTALRLTAEMYERSGQAAEAIRRYRQVVEAGNASGLERLAHLLDRSGRHDEAHDVTRYGLLPGGATAQPWSNV